MQWQDQAIIIGVRKFSEQDAVVSLFSRTHGLYSGVVKAAYASSQRGIYQAGNVVAAQWKARLAEHMGTCKAELEWAYAAAIMQNRDALLALNALSALLPLAVHERDPHPALYDAAAHMLAALAAEENWHADYVRFELLLLQEAGYGLHLSECVATGVREELVYVSPKSGGAVCASAGAPYHEKLLKLPAFLSNNEMANAEEIHAGLTLTGYFLTHWLLPAIGKKMPEARMQLAETFMKLSQKQRVESL